MIEYGFVDCVTGVVGRTLLGYPDYVIKGLSQIPEQD